MPRTIKQNQDLRSRSAAFTLIEILVTISIIAILAAIAFPVMTALLQAATATQTKALLKQLDSAVVEYEAKSQTKPIGPLVTNYDYPDGSGTASDDASFRTVAVNRLTSVAESRDILNTVEKNAIRTRDPQQNVIAVNDGWGKPVRFFPGTLAMDDAGYSVAATRIENLGMRRRKNPYFASAGQDGVWGTIDEATDTPDAAASDNHYSFEAD